MFIVIFSCLVIALGVCTAAYYVFRDIRTRRLMSDIDKTITFETDSSHEASPPESAAGYTDSVPAAGSSATSVDPVDFILNDGSSEDQFKDAEQFSDSRHPNDILGEDSEWVENKRLPPTAHIC